MYKVHRTPENRRKAKVRSKISGTAERPRLSVFRSNRYISVQAIDDLVGKTIATVRSKEIGAAGPKIEQAKNVGLQMGAKLKELKIKNCVYDRSSYRYHGRVKSLADGIREAGINI